MLSVELGASLLLPLYTTRVLKRTEAARNIATESLRPLRNDVIGLLPPAIGRRYSIQGPTATDAAARTLRDHMLGRSEDEKERLLQQVQQPDDVLPRLMDFCFDGSAEEMRIEDVVVRTVASGKVTSSPETIYDRLLANYFFPAQRSQFAGFIDDAKRLYSRFLLLARTLSTNTALSEDAITQRQLNRAQVRIKILDWRHVLTPQPVRTIQTRPAEELKVLLRDPDSITRAYARYELASLYWHSDQQSAARTVLEGSLGECGQLYDECEFLLAKIVEPDDAGHSLEVLSARLPDGHYLLDDVYWHRISTARDQHNQALGVQLINEARRRCPNTDRAFSFGELERELTGKAVDSNRAEPK